MPRTSAVPRAGKHIAVRPFTVRDLQDLLGAREGPCVSIYEPSHARPDGSGEDRMRWRNLLDDARAKLEAASHPKTASRLLDPLTTLDAGAFRHGDEGGLAAFAADGFVRVFRVHTALPERVVVADSFHVRPLLAWLQAAKRHYVLALSRKHVRVFEGVDGTLVEKDVPGLPRKIEDAAHSAAANDGANVHGATGRRSYGDNGPRSPQAELAPFFRAIDHAICAFLRDEHVPLLLAGVSRSISVYRTVSRYPALAHDHIEGNFDRAGADEIRERAEPIVAAITDAPQKEAAAEFQNLVGSFRSSDDLRLVAKTAVAGRVRRLLLAHGKLVRGQFDRTTGEITKKGARDSSLGDDLGDDLAEAVLLRGGEVLTLAPENMPSDQPVAAIFRW
jgi:hypothetical protein